MNSLLYQWLISGFMGRKWLISGLMVDFGQERIDGWFLGWFSGKISSFPGKSGFSGKIWVFCVDEQWWFLALDCYSNCWRTNTVAIEFLGLCFDEQCGWWTRTVQIRVLGFEPERKKKKLRFEQIRREFQIRSDTMLEFEIWKSLYIQLYLAVTFGELHRK